jgi:CHAT domain-containing protein
MKSVVNRASLLLAVAHLMGTMIAEPVRVRAITPPPDITNQNSINPENLLFAQSTVPPHLRALDQNNVSQAVPLIDQNWEKDFENYFRTNLTDQSMSVQKIASILGIIGVQTGKKPALVYMVPRAEQLEIVLITPEGKPIHKRVKEANREALLKQIQALTGAIVNPIRRNTKQYLSPAQQLYQWTIAPVEEVLKAEKIDTLLFCVGTGLRSAPLAAFHDGKQFLIEKYSFSRIPAFKLINTVYGDLRNSSVLGMGASEFQDQNPLPAVPVELSTIQKNLWQGKFFLNQDFTLANLESQQASQPYRIIHLATHAFFQPGEPRNSYIQFWNKKLTLDEMKQLHWNNPPVELLVLSACKTAIGDEKAELGFAGLAVQANVKSALASLWNVSDEGTLALMTEFYRDLKTAPIKAEALREAQMAMLKGQIRIEGGQLHTSQGNIPLPPSLAEIENKDLSHPYYWAAFTVVGSPW